MLLLDAAAAAVGLLYIIVLPKTVLAPITNPGVIGKSKRTTEATEEMTIEIEVANPFKI